MSDYSTECSCGTSGPSTGPGYHLHLLASCGHNIKEKNKYIFITSGFFFSDLQAAGVEGTLAKNTVVVSPSVPHCCFPSPKDSAVLCLLACMCMLVC